MDSEKLVALIALAWLIGACILLARSIQRGRRLADLLAERYPEAYETLGRPRPGFFDSPERRRFARFVGRREFTTLLNPELSEQFEQHRRSETRLMVSLLLSLAFVGLLILLYR